MLWVQSRSSKSKKTRLSDDDRTGRMGMYGLEAIERTIGQNLVWKQFIKGVRVMKLTYHIGALNHYTSLTKNHEVTLNLLMDLKESSNLPEHRRTGTIFFVGAEVILPECDVTKNDVISLPTSNVY